MFLRSQHNNIFICCGHWETPFMKKRDQNLKIHFHIARFRHSELENQQRSSSSQERNTSNCSNTYSFSDSKRTPNQINGGETVVSLKYIPRSDPSTTRSADSRRGDEHTSPESQTRTYLYSRSTPKIADKRAAADLLQSKLSARARGETHNPRNTQRAPPYPGSKPTRPPNTLLKMKGAG